MPWLASHSYSRNFQEVLVLVGPAGGRYRSAAHSASFPDFREPIVGFICLLICWVMAYGLPRKFPASSGISGIGRGEIQEYSTFGFSPGLQGD
jgi:hypothetical protein